MKILTKSISIISLNLLLLISTNLVAATSSTIRDDKYQRDAEKTIKKAKKLKGYKVKFDYHNYPKEREIAYQFYLDKYNVNMPGLTKNDIGIDLYDLDNDGEKEILLYINLKDQCPMAGCTFATIKPFYNSNNAKKYREIMWSSKNGVSLGIYAPPKILNNITLDYHDMLTGPNTGNAAIWKWNGEFYERNFIGNPVGNQVARDLEELQKLQE